MASQREEKLLKNARALREKEHRLRPSLRLHTLREAEDFVQSRGLVSVLGGNELPSIISAFLGREWKPSGKGFTGWLDWWSLKVSGKSLGRSLASLERSKDIVSTRIFRKSKTLVSREMWPILDPIVRYHSALASSHDMFSEDEWKILEFIEDNGPTRTDQLREKLELQGKSHTGPFHVSLSRLESYGLIIGHEDPSPERHLHANIWETWKAKTNQRIGRRRFSYEEAAEKLLSKTVDAAILAPEKEVAKWFQWKQSCLDAKEKLLDAGRILQAETFLVTPRVAQ